MGFRRLKSGAVGVFLLLLASQGSVDVWQRGSDGELSLHRSLDHFQRARMAKDWRPPTFVEQAERREMLLPIVRQAAITHGVNEAHLFAIIEVESAYDDQAVSRAGAMGLMQLMPKTAERLSVTDPFDAAQNIDAGARYLRLLMDEFESIELVLAAYNAGEEAVRQYQRQIPPYAETRAYIERVLAVIDDKRPNAPRKPSER